MFSPVSICLLVGWLVCQQDHTQSAEQFAPKLGWRIGLLLTFPKDLHIEKDSATVCKFSNPNPFLCILVNLGDNAGE